MSNLFSEISQLNRDYDNLINQLKEIIPHLTEDWKDFSDSDLGMFLVKTFAAIKDMQAYHFDQQILETMFPTVRERSNLISMLQLIGYTLSSYKSSRVSISPVESTSVNHGDTFKEDGSDTVWTYLGDDVNPLSTADTIEVYQGTLQKWPVSEGEEANVTFSSYVDTNGNTVQKLISDNGNYNYLKLAISGVNDKVAIDNTTYITIGGSYDNDWTEVQDFVEYINDNRSNPNINLEHIYKLYVDRDNKTYIEFYNVSDLVNETNVRVNFLVTKDPEFISKGTSLYKSGTSESFTISAFEVGSLPEPVEHAKEEAPKFARTLNRAVTVEDYEYLVQRYLEFDDSSSFKGYKKYGISVVDLYKNNNAYNVSITVSGVTTVYSSEIDNYPEEPFKVVVYSLVSLDDNIDVNNANLDFVKKIEFLNDNNSQALDLFLSKKRMVGVNCFSNDIPDTGVWVLDRSVPNLPVKLTRLYIKCSYSLKSGTVDLSKIRSMLSDYYSLSNISYGRFVSISDIFRLIVSLYPNMEIDVSSGIELEFYDDEDGDSDSYLGGTPVTGNYYISKLNEAIVFGGIEFSSGV